MKIFCKFFVLFFTHLVISCSGQTTKSINNLEPKAFSDKIAATKNAQIIDVRTAQEFAGGNIDNAINIDWLGDNFETNVQKIDKTKPVFVYCKSGGRSAKAAARLAEIGFKNIYELQGGFLKWDSEGLSKPSDKTIGITREQYAKLINKDKKVLINFYAKWCAPCKKMAPYLEKMQTEMAGKVVIIRLDADENKTIIKERNITELPTLILYENNKIKWQNSGFISEEDLKKQL